MPDQRRYPIAVGSWAPDGSRTHLWLPVSPDQSLDGKVQALCRPARQTATRLTATRAELDPQDQVDCFGCGAILKVARHTPTRSTR